MFNKGQLADLMKQAQTMQQNIQKVHEELERLSVTGVAASGGVRVTMTCKHLVQKVEIAPEFLREEKEMLEALIATAFNAALSRAEEVSAEKLGKFATGMFGMPDLPGGLKLPF